MVDRTNVEVFNGRFVAIYFMTQGFQLLKLKLFCDCAFGFDFAYYIAGFFNGVIHIIRFNVKTLCHKTY